MSNYYETIGALPEHSGDLLRTYVLGFALSIVCTLAAYFAVAAHLFSSSTAIGLVVVLALAQCVVQGACFLHISVRSRLKLLILGGALLVVTILVSGSLWIMFTLNGRMMPPSAQMEQYMQDQDGF